MQKKIEFLMTTGPDLPFHTKCNRVNNLRYDQDESGSSSNGAGRGRASFLCTKGCCLLVVSTTLPERKHYSTKSPMLGRGSVSLVMNKAESQESSASTIQVCKSTDPASSNPKKRRVFRYPTTQPKLNLHSMLHNGEPKQPSWVHSRLGGTV